MYLKMPLLGFGGFASIKVIGIVALPTALLWVLPKGSFLPPQHTRAFSILPLLMLRESNATCQGTLSHLLPPRMGWR